MRNPERAPMTGDSQKAPRPLSIAQVVETLDTGGAEHLAIKFANKLAERGHRSHLYVTSHTGPLAASISPEVQVDILGYRRESIVNPFKFTRSINDGFNRLKSRIRRDDVQVIQTHLPSPNFWGLALSMRGVCRSVATIHNNKEFSYGSERSFRGSLRHQAYRTIVRRCAATIAVSDQVRVSFMEELGMNERQASRLVSVPNGVEIFPERSPEEKRVQKVALGFNPDTVMCLAVGRACEQKNFKDLVPVMQVLKEQGVPVTMVIAGDGPDLPDLKDRISAAGLGDDIHTLGNVTNIPDYLVAADIFLMPSLWEGLPLALLEAMASGLPVVGNSIDGLTDVVIEGTTGHLVPPGDSSLMAARIQAQAQDPALRQTLGSAGRHLVAERYNLKRVIESIENIYYRVLGLGQD